MRNLFFELNKGCLSVNQHVPVPGKIDARSPSLQKWIQEVQGSLVYLKAIVDFQAVDGDLTKFKCEYSFRSKFEDYPRHHMALEQVPTDP